MRGLLTRVLQRRCGLRIVEAADGFRAYEALHTEKIAAVVSDIGLPGLSGLELVEIAKRMYPDMPFFLLTARPDAHIAAVRASRADGFFTKPFNVQALAAAVLDVMHRRA